MNQPDDYNESNTQPRHILKGSIRSHASGTGWDIARWLFDNPWKGYTIVSYVNGDHGYKAEILVKLLDLGLIAQAHNGYQLTADGRYYVARDLEQEREDLTRAKARDEGRYQTFDDYAEWERFAGGWDLLELF